MSFHSKLLSHLSIPTVIPDIKSWVVAVAATQLRFHGRKASSPVAMVAVLWGPWVPWVEPPYCWDG